MGLIFGQSPTGLEEVASGVERESERDWAEIELNVCPSIG